MVEGDPPTPTHTIRSGQKGLQAPPLSRPEKDPKQNNEKMGKNIVIIIKLLLSNMFSCTFVPNLLVLKNEPQNAKIDQFIKCFIIQISMRQNLHDQIYLRSTNNKYTCQV